MAHGNEFALNERVIEDKHNLYPEHVWDYRDYRFTEPMALRELEPYKARLNRYKIPYVILEIDYLAPMKSDPKLTRLYRGYIMLVDQSTTLFRSYFNNDVYNYSQEGDDYETN